MKYFVYANTEKKPVMRFFDHWFEVHDFLAIQEGLDNHIKIYCEMEEKEIEEKNGS